MTGVKVETHLERLWGLFRWGKNAGSQISPSFWHAWLQVASTSAFTTWSALSGGQLPVLEQKSWHTQKKRGNQMTKRLVFLKWQTSFLNAVKQHSSNLFFDQDVDPLEHPLTGKLIGDVRLNLKWIYIEYSYSYTYQRKAVSSKSSGLFEETRTFDTAVDGTYCLIEDSIESSLHFHGVVHIYRPYIRLSDGLSVRVLWCHLQRQWIMKIHFYYTVEWDKKIVNQIIVECPRFEDNTPTSLMVGLSLKNSEFNLVCGGCNLGFRKAQPLAKASKGAGPSYGKDKPTKTFNRAQKN